MLLEPWCTLCTPQAQSTAHYVKRAVIFERGVFVTDKTDPKRFVFNKCYDICFYNFCNKHPHGKKTLLKSEKWMLKRARYLVYDYLYFL